MLPAAASAATPIAVGVVERAFASVRLIEANVRVGGLWLTQKTASELIVGEAGDPVLRGSLVMGLSSLIDTVCVCAYYIHLPSNAIIKCSFEIGDRTEWGCGDDCMNRAVSCAAFLSRFARCFDIADARRLCSRCATSASWKDVLGGRAARTGSCNRARRSRQQ
jgi:hypothetical protein